MTKLHFCVYEKIHAGDKFEAVGFLDNILRGTLSDELFEILVKEDDYE